MQEFNLFIFTFCKTLHECSENAEAECTCGMIAATVFFYFLKWMQKKKEWKRKTSLYPLAVISYYLRI